MKKYETVIAGVSKQEITTGVLRDVNWRGEPKSVMAWAAFNEDGSIVPNSVRFLQDQIRITDKSIRKVSITYVDDLTGNYWAALDYRGRIIPNSVRDSLQGVRLAAGECVPINVLVKPL